MQEDNMQGREIVFKSYSNIWKVERFLKHLSGAKMSSPVSLTNAAYFICIACVEIFLILIFPPIKKLPWVVLIGIPFAITLLLKKVKLDGRNPVLFLSKVTEHLFKPKVIERFRNIETEDEIILFNKFIPYRKTYLFQSNKKEGE